MKNLIIVTAFRELAINVHHSVSHGDRVIVSGGLRIRDWATVDKTGTQVEIEAAVVGHDLNWDWHFTSTTTAAQEEAEAEAAQEISDTQNVTAADDPATNEPIAEPITAEDIDRNPTPPS